MSTATTPAELQQLAAALAAPTASERERAFASLSTLPSDALPAIAARVQTLADPRHDEAALDAITAFRRLQGVHAADADVDLALGVLPHLARDRSRAALLAAELIALLRSLERQRTPAAAQLALLELVGSHSRLLRFEAPRSLDRLGPLAIPALIRGQSHRRPSIRRLSALRLEAMGADSPGQAVQQNDVALLAAILEAYGDILFFDAMPVIASHLTDERRAVADAARASIRKFRRNAIWQLREVYRNVAGEDAPAELGSERLLQRIAELHAAPKRARIAALLATAGAALDRGALDDAAVALDEALNVRPGDDALSDAGPLYAQLADGYLKQEQPVLALSAARRAHRLLTTPDRSLAARLAYLEADARRRVGLLDVQGYEDAASLDPTLREAADAYDAALGTSSQRERTRRHIAGLAAACLLLAASLFLLRAGRGRRPDAPAAPAAEPDDALVASRAETPPS